MFSRTPFSQANLLKSVHDPEARKGVCVALCDFWLHEIKQRPNDSPAQRLSALSGERFARAVKYQQEYGQRRATVGREEARQEMGASLGLVYDSDRTQVLRVCVGLDGMIERAQHDLGSIGAAATWTMQFENGDRHAIAGFRGLQTLTSNMHRQTLHIFDPNCGEYLGELGDFERIFQDLFGDFPIYRTACSFDRTGAN